MDSQTEPSNPGAELSEFLAERDVSCPECAHQLRGLETNACPQCGKALSIDLVRQSSKEPDETIGTIFRKLGPAGWLGVFAAVMPAIGGIVLIGSYEVVSPWLQSHELSGVGLYVIAFILLAGFALLPTYAQAGLGGWAFGFFMGLPAALLGFFGASLIGYELGKRASGDRVMTLLDQHSKWRAVRDALVGEELGFFKTLGMVTLIRLPPNSPFAITNIVLSSVRVPRVPYALGTLFGMAPRTGVVVFLAAQIQGSAFDKDAVSKPWWYWVAAIGSSLLMIIVLYVVGSRAVARVGKSGNSSSETDATNE